MNSEAEPLRRLLGDACETIVHDRSRPISFKPGPAWSTLFDRDQAEQWLNLAAVRPPYIKLMKDGVEVPEKRFTRPRTVARERLEGFVSAGAVAEEMKLGASVIFYSVNDWFGPARKLCGELRSALRCCVQLTVFATPPGGRGAIRHVDDAHVYVTQVSGAKTWHLWPIGSTTDDGVPPTEIRLQPGDGLYVPMWTPHLALTTAETGSLHFAVTVRPPRVQDALAFASGRARGSLDVPEFLAGDRDDRRTLLAEALADLAEAIRILDVDLVLSAAEARAGCIAPQWAELLC